MYSTPFWLTKCEIKVCAFCMMNGQLCSFSCCLQCDCFLLTFIIMPHTDLGQFAQAEQVRKSKRVFVFTLKLVPVGAGLQRQRPSIPVLSEHNQKHVGISACTCVYQGKKTCTFNYSEVQERGFIYFVKCPLFAPAISLVWTWMM